MILSRKDIITASEQVGEFLERSGIEAKTRLRYTLLLEELLIEYMTEHENAAFDISYKSRFSQISIILSVGCSKKNLLDNKNKIINNLLSGFEKMPEWKYRKNKNIITWTTKPVGPDYSNVKEVLRYMARKKRSFVAGVIIRFIQMLFNIIEPLLSAKIIIAYTESEIKKILILAALLLGQAACNSLLNFLASKMLREAYSSMIKDMKYDLTENILQIKTECMDENGSGVFTQRLNNETTNIADHIDEVLAASTDLFRLISLIIAFALISVKMLVYQSVLFVFYVAIQRAHMRNLTDDNRRTRSAIEKHTSFTGEMVRAHRDIKLMHCEDSFMAKLHKSIDDSVDLTTDMRVRSMKFILLRSQFVGWTNFIYIALQMANGTMTASTALILYNYNGRFYSCSNSISQIMSSLNELALASERVYQLMNSRDYEKETFGEKHLDEVRGDIELKDVHFSYKRANGSKVPVLRGIDLHIKAGEFVAFVGQSGCGKSTILSLISCLYEPDSGSITLDGCSVSELDQDSLRGSIQMVSQMPYIFNMSIRENLAVVKKDITDEEMREACKLACIHDDIMKLPQGYDTVVGEGGISLSGGQRQRLAIARSIVREYPIIMLDEATSALDNITQSKIRTAIYNMQGKCTIIMIDHRLYTVINCEHLFFIENGRVLAEGTHQQLLENCTKYRELYFEESGSSTV